MIWMLLIGTLFIVTLGMAVVNFFRDRRYLGRRTREVMQRELKREVEVEGEELHRRHERFTAALRAAEKKQPR